MKKAKKKEKKIRIKKKKKDLREKPKGFKLRLPFRKKADNTSAAAEIDSFGASVHSTEPILRLKDFKEQAAWKQDIVLNCACAALLMTAIALFCMSFGSPDLILFALPCPVVFMVIAMIDSVKPGMIRWLAAGIFAAILMITAIIWRADIFDGLGTLVNWFYDAAEEAQAYVYDRIPVEGATEGAIRAGIAWASGLTGLVGALPPVKVRHAFSGLIAIAIMIALAYYGLIPSAICIAVMIAALIMAVARGNFLSIVPVVLAALLLFGAIVLVDPGENYAVSRINENLRDRFALNSALLENQESYYDDMESFEDDMQDEESMESEEDGESDAEIGKYAIIGFIALAVAILGAAVFLFIRRLRRKRAENREGIDSDDTREAVIAMFPYAVRWLKGYGIEQPGPSFVSMEPELEREFSETYSDLFMEMHDVWSEAAYSDHTIPEGSRLLMDGFVRETIDQVKKKCKLRDKLRLKWLYAL